MQDRAFLILLAIDKLLSKYDKHSDAPEPVRRFTVPFGPSVSITGHFRKRLPVSVWRRTSQNANSPTFIILHRNGAYEAQEVAEHATGGRLATHRTPDNLK